EILDYGNLSGMIESIEKSQESIRKNRNPHRVIPHRPSFPQKRESSNRKTTGIYQQKQKPPPTVIPAKAGIQTRRHGNLLDKTVSLDSTS
ncbi:TPA: hypothetical protein ACJJDS_002108, partial [Neisseria meningitidis]